jgi:hypothetical protein
MSKKTKAGEEYSAVYQTSFDVNFRTDEGEYLMIKARVHVPKSEARFYTLIHKMAEADHINELTRLSAELQCFRKGYTTVA